MSRSIYRKRLCELAAWLWMERWGGGWSSGRGWPQSASCGIPGMGVELEFVSEEEELSAEVIKRCCMANCFNI